MCDFLNNFQTGELPFSDIFRYLGEIENPPKNIYYAGNLQNLDNFRVGIIGSRLASREAIDVANGVSGALSEIGFTIVSGLAKGIDAAAHLANPSKTIAILGHGLQEIYPTQNLELARNIFNKGLILTEYSYGTPIAKFRFVARNRLIAGLSHVLIVIQAGENSGSLITASEAIKLGIPIFVWIPPAGAGEGEKLLLAWGARPFIEIRHIIGNLRKLEGF